VEPSQASSEQQQLALLVTSTTDYAIFMLDPTGRIQTWNPGAQRLKGYQRDEILGKHFSIFYTQPDIDRDHPADELRIAVAEGSYSEEGWRVRKDGSTFWASVTITAIRRDGELTGFGKVTRDLTERREAEQELRRAIDELALANEELDRFASVAAHDMTDPLRTISGFAEFLERPEIPATDRIAYAGHIRSSSVRLTTMLHGLLAYARAGANGLADSAVSVRPVAESVVADLHGLIADRRATVEIWVPADAEVIAQRADLQIVLQNLVSNAIKFGALREPKISIEADRLDDNWRVWVVDDGDGVSADDVGRIFGAFERADSREVRAGYGLGLAICKRLIERRGGAIGVERIDGPGSRFWFTLPAA
jgi:PAS domain S-box-containing protein